MLKTNTSRPLDASGNCIRLQCDPANDSTKAALTIRMVEGWTIASDGEDGEPMAKDLEVAERLGYANPHDIRKLIRRLVAEGKLSNVKVFATVAKTGGGRPGKEFWLTESQALKVAAKSETDAADALLDEMIRVFMLARNGKLQPQAAPLDMDAAKSLFESLLATVLPGMFAASVAPLVVKVNSLEAAIVNRHEPDLVASKQEMDRSVSVLARSLVDLGDYTSVRAAKTAIQQQVAAASGWGGTGRTRHLMPEDKRRIAMAAIQAMQHQADRRLKKLKPVRVERNGQTNLLALFDDARRREQSN